MNALRGVPYEYGHDEYGHVVPQGIRHLGRIETIPDDAGSDLPALVREECQDLMEQIAEKTTRIEAKSRKARELAAQSDAAHRLQTMLGVGPLTAMAVEAFASDMSAFGRGRDRDHKLEGPERLASGAATKEAAC